MSDQTPPEAAWAADPTGRHQYRYFDGAGWTDNVADNGQQAIDTLAAQPPPDRKARREARRAEFQARIDEAKQRKGARHGAMEDLATANGDAAAQAAKLRGRVKRLLAENMAEGETLEVVIRGVAGQAIVGTDRRAIVLKPGWMAGATLGAEVTSWSYRNIVGVQVHKGMVTGAVVIQAPGQSGTSTSYWSAGDGDPYKAPNAIPVAGEWAHVRAGAAMLQCLVDNFATAVSAPSPNPPSGTLVDRLRDLTSLWEAGALTAEEFAAAKRKLLGSS